MADNSQIIDLYTDLAKNPNKDFGWNKGFQNAKDHNYKKEWIDAIDSKVWEYCAAVGNPFTNANIKKGDTLLDLGCGAGVDVLVARLLVGDNGEVFGVDITPKMVELASLHAKNENFKNVTIFEANFSELKLPNNSVDVVISNGAINLTACKESVFKEIYRVLKDDGKLYFADMIDISEKSCCSIEKNVCTSNNEQDDWANCVSGTMSENELIEIIKNSGFKNVKCTGHTHYKTAQTTNGAVFEARK